MTIRMLILYFIYGMNNIIINIILIIIIMVITLILILIFDDKNVININKYVHSFSFAIT